MRAAHTKTNDPIKVMLDTGNPDHLVDSVDHLSSVNLFDSPKFPAQFRIRGDMAVAAFFNKLPTLSVYTWNLGSEPIKDQSTEIWRRRPTRSIVLDLSMFDIFDDDHPVLGDIHVSGKFVGVYLECVDVIVVLDLSRQKDVTIKAIHVGLDSIAFCGYFVENDRHYFAFEEENYLDDTNDLGATFLSLFVAKDDHLRLYTRIDDNICVSSLKRADDKIFMTAAQSNDFHLVTLDKEEQVDRHLTIRPNIKFVSSKCRFKLEEICRHIVAVCSCQDHICSFDLTTQSNLFSNRTFIDVDTKLEQETPPPEGIDFVINPTKERHAFFENMGNWYRIWLENERWKYAANANIKIPDEIDADATFYPTMIHSRSQCSLIYDYMPPKCSSSEVPMLNLFI